MSVCWRSMEELESGGLLSRGNILLIEDKDEVRTMMVDFLDCMGHKVLACIDEESCLLALKEHGDTIQLVVTDVVLEATTGPKLVRRIRQVYPSMPVIFMSGYSQPALKKLLARETNYDFLQKPFSMKSLNQKISKAVPWESQIFSI